jgi:NAD(P)-dependent dehydrogenase (short-subunit alcohol dehydrogenase family)
MDLKNSIVLITGGNRGFGKSIVEELLKADVQKVYAGSRTLASSSDPRIHPLQLDITNAHDIAAAVDTCQDINVLINNAGTYLFNPFLTAHPSREKAHEEMDTNYFGTLAMVQAFAPILKKNGGGMIINILSALSWLTIPALATYCASKAAALALTNGIRIELRSQETQVIGVFAGFIDTERVKHVDQPKISPALAATNLIEGILAGQEEILADPMSKQFKALLAANPQAVYQQIQQGWDRFIPGSWDPDLGQ